MFFSSKLAYTPLQRIEEAVIEVQDGKISRVIRRSAVEISAAKAVKDFGNSIITPGFMDVHIHGAVGCDVMRGNSGEMAAMEQFLARHGVTSYFPTTVSAPLEVTLSALERLAERIDGETRDHSGARPVGIHLEGPFLSHAKRGVHRTEDLITPSIGVFEKLWQAARGHVRMMTIAPELDCAPEVISMAAKKGVCVSIGHSNATLAEARRGVEAGARHATHAFNAMRAFDHREPGILGEVLTNDRLSADVIADGVHVDPSVVEILLKTKGLENFVLITDGISATGMPDGRYHLGTLEVELKDGRCMSDGKLAGSVLTMDRAVRNAMKFANLNLQQAVQASSANPARVAQIANKGVIEPGADADFVVLSPEGDVRATVVGGVVIE